MGVFDKADFGGTKAGGGGQYIEPGNYLVRVNRCQMVESEHKRTTFFVAELEVLASDNDDIREGAILSHTVDMFKFQLDFAVAEVKAFALPAFQSLAIEGGEDVPKDEDIGNEEIKAAVGEEQILAEAVLRLYAYNKPTKEGKPFTRKKWSVPSNQELAAVREAAA